MRYLSRMFLCIFLMSILFSLGSCKKDSSPTGPAGPTSIVANGTLSATSRTQCGGIVFVADQNGSAITGLTVSNFNARLLYGAGISKIAADSVIGSVLVQTVSASGKKIAAAMTMDYSGSMYSGDTVKGGKYKRIADMETGVKAFVSAMTTGDRGEIIKFGDNVDFVVPFTTNTAVLSLASDSASYDRGSTALYASMYRGLQDAAQQSSTTFARAIIAFTDGGENNSYPLTRSDVFNLSQQNGIPVYTVGLIDSSYHTNPPSSGWGEELDLVQIADSTGGFYYYAPSTSQLSQIYQRISGNLSNATQLTITWPTSGLPPSGTTVRAVVTVTYNGLSSTFTRTYVIP